MTSNIFEKQSLTSTGEDLQCEVFGLEKLRSQQSKHGLCIPTVISLTKTKLALEKIHCLSPNSTHWIQLGKGLAALHRVTGTQFGLEKSNFIGRSPQRNDLCDNWGEFFLNFRLKFQIQRLTNKSLLSQFLSRMEGFQVPLISFLNAHKPLPSMVHGDLWSGNVLFDQNGPWLIDPALYYGDREVDLAITELFGGFAPDFYEAYNKAFPLPLGHSTRAKVYNLYHYLNHLNIFGDSYLSSVHNHFDFMEKLFT